MATSKLVLFDIPTREPVHAWSFNTWRVRMLLNLKGIDYETEWLEYPEIKPRLQPHFPGKENFTVPTIKQPDGTYIMDSFEIAQAIEKEYPTPSLNLDSPLRQKCLDHLSKALGEMMPNYILAVPERLLKEVNYPYWHETRSAWVGMPLEQYVKENGGEKAFKAAAPHLQAVTALLKENTEGPLFMGKQISYTDLILAGLLLSLRTLGDDMFQAILEGSGEPQVLLDFLEYLKPYTERDSY
ncbi:putative glutathione S-transferase [Xylaria intraflava]|nr:putative glutathione S-transferase [Xylaria intraflava]